MAEHSYSAYGLVIQSELEFQELLEGSGEPDVCLHLGEVPDRPKTSPGHPVMYEIHENEFLANLAGIAHFWVKDGNEIVIQPAQGGLDAEVRLYLFGMCLGALLHQRGILALHASAIETPRGAVLFAGPSGIGKSTLMTAFLNKGYYMLADDVTGIVLDADGCPIALPALPRSKLWSDAVEHLGHDLNTLPRLRPSEEKYELSVPERFAHQPSRLSTIYLLANAENEEIKIRTLDKRAGFQAVLNNTYRETFLRGLDSRKSHLKLATTTAAHARIIHVSRPRDLRQLGEVVELLEADFLS